LEVSEMSDWTSAYLTLIEDCENRSEQLSDWESSFIDSIKTQIAAGRRPTQKQIETLDNVWEKATSKG
jgi:hypothetical protein